MSPARAPGAVKARNCLLSSRSHAPGSRSRWAEEAHSGAGPRGEACVSRGVGCVGRVLKKRSAAKVWVRSARGVSKISLERLGLKIAIARSSQPHGPHAKDTRVVHSQTNLLLLFSCFRVFHSSSDTNIGSPVSSLERDGNYHHHHHHHATGAERMPLSNDWEARHNHPARSSPGVRAPFIPPQLYRRWLPKQDQGAEKTALQLTGTPALQAETQLQRPRLQIGRASCRERV